MVLHRFNLLCLAFAFSACGSRESSATSGGAASVAPASAAPQTSTVASATPSPTSSAASASADPDEQSPDTWLVVSSSDGELGVIELRSGQPPKLSIETPSPATAELEAKLKAVSGPEGIGIDMHLPPPTGTGRGPYGTRIVTYDDRLYRHALKNALEPAYSVREVVGLSDPLPPATLKTLHVSRSGQHVGDVDFTKAPPALTVDEKQIDSGSLKNDLDMARDRGALTVRYRVSDGGAAALVTARAKPGDAAYAQTVALFLMVERAYRKRYAYELSFEG